MDARLSRGELAPIAEWLKAQVHERASLHDTDDLVRLASGAALSADALLAHLEARYLG